MPIWLLSDVDIATKPDGTYDDGNGLRLRVRKNGRSRTWVWRCNTRPWGGRPDDTISFGSARKTSAATRARELAEFCQSLMARGIDPRQWRAEDRKRRAKLQAATVTFEQEVRSYYKFGCDALWGKKAREQARSVVRNLLGIELEAQPLAGDQPQNRNRLKAEEKHRKRVQVAQHLYDVTLQEIEAHHLAPLLPNWKGKPGSGRDMDKRLITFLYGMFKVAIAGKKYFGPNPASVAEGTPLWILIGGNQLPVQHRIPPHLNDIPRYVAYLSEPPRPNPGWATTAELAEAYDKNENVFRKARDKELLPSAQRYADWGTASYIYRIDEVKAVFGEFVRPLRRHQDIPVEWSATLFMILTGGVRSEQVCELRWPYIREADGLIIYPPSEHKAGKKTGEVHEIILTDRQDQILDRMRVQQNQDKTYDPKGHVFKHRKTRTGLDYFAGDPLKPEGIGVLGFGCEHTSPTSSSGAPCRMACAPHLKPGSWRMSMLAISPGWRWAIPSTTIRRMNPTAIR